MIAATIAIRLRTLMVQQLSYGEEIANESMGMWRKRYLQHGIAGLYVEKPRGHPRSHADEQVAKLMRRALSTKPKDATHWSVRSFAKASGISKSVVQRYFALFGIQPHRSKSFKLSTDPFLWRRCATSWACI